MLGLAGSALCSGLLLLRLNHLSLLGLFIQLAFALLIAALHLSLSLPNTLSGISSSLLGLMIQTHLALQFMRHHHTPLGREAAAVPLMGTQHHQVGALVFVAAHIRHGALGLAALHLAIAKEEVTPLQMTGQ